MRQSVMGALCTGYGAISEASVRKVVLCVKRNLFVTLTKQHKDLAKLNSRTIALTIGKPNWWARERLRTNAIAPGEMWTFEWPKKRRKP